MIRIILALLFAMPAYAQVGPIPYSALGKPGGPPKLDSGGTLRLGVQGWLETLIGGSESAAINTFSSISGTGSSGGIFGTRSSDTTNTGGQSFSLGGFGINNNNTQIQTIYAGYFEARRYPGAGITHGIEINIINEGNTVTMTPYPTSLAGFTPALWLSSGRTDVLASTDSSVAIGIINNGKAFAEGIVFQQNALVGTDNSATSLTTAAAISMPRGDEIRWFEPTNDTVAARIRSDVTSHAGVGGIIVFADVGIALQTSTSAALLTLTPSVALFSEDLSTSGGITSSGYNKAAGFVQTNGPVWFSGAGVPTITQPIGSLFSRIDGGVGSTFYVSRGGGVWNAVPGV